ncbi:hypothetical protein [Chitinophaga skermanii]|nr:hypothetical protein [Chitinophaga skermanii]
MILSLSVAVLLRGTVRFVQHPGRLKIYWVHLAWVFYLFLLLLHFWWWEIYLRTIQQWYFTEYFFVIMYILLFYILASMLYPDDLRDHKEDFQVYFYSRKKWFFAILASTYLFDFVDTLIKGEAYYRHYTWEYPVRNMTHFILCLVAIRVNNKRFQEVLVVGFILYELLYIFRLFLKEG